MVNKRTKVRCAVPGCENNSGGDKLASFFIVPKDIRRRKWLRAMKIKYTNSPKILICELHFDKNDIEGNTSRKRVIHGRVPTLNLPPETAPLAPFKPKNVNRNSQVPEVLEIKPEPPDVEDDPIIDIFTVEETAVAQKRTLADTGVSTQTLNGIPIKRERTDDQEGAGVDESFSQSLSPPPSTPTVGNGRQPARSLSTPAPVQRTRSIPATLMTNLGLLINLSKAFLSPELAKFVEVQALLKTELQSAFEGQQCSEEIIFFALRLYHFFPRTYKLMREYVCMPSTLKIKQKCRNLSWEINDTWERVVRARFERASADQRECVVCVAKVPLHLRLSYDPVRDRLVGLDEVDGTQRQRAARHATVVYARGILSRWQQPLSYALLGFNTPPDEVWIWIDIIISKLLDVGLNVRAVVTDVEHNYVPMIRPIPGNKTYFQVKGRQIYLFYDCTQLMIKFRDCFMRYTVNFKGMIASWEVIEELYDYDCTRRYKLAPQLTDRHVRPPASAAGRADLAVQALSPQVAAALAAAVDLRVLDDSAHGTVQLISTFSTLYEILNTKELFATGNKITPEIKFLNEMLMNFERITLVDSHDHRNLQDPGVVRAFRANVLSTMALLERMRRAGHESLPMRAFNNDLLRRLFHRARENSHKPTARQLVDAFRQSFGFHVMKSFSAPEGKLDAFLEMASGVKDAVVEVAVTDESKISLARRLVREVKPSHYAPLMKARLTPPVARFLLAQCLSSKPCCDLGAEYCRAPLAPQAFVDFLTVIERKFRLYFSADSLTEGAVSSLLSLTQNDEFPTPCPCFPILYLKALYLRFRIANLIQFNNIKYKEHASRYFTMNILHH